MYTANIPVNNIIPNNILLDTHNETVEVLDSIAIYEHVCEKTKRKRVLTLNLVGTTPAHLMGWELVKKRGLMTVGISPGNGYFSKDRLEVILLGMSSYFQEVVVIIPDLPALHTYHALGYDEHHAMERMKKHKRDKRGVCKQIMEQACKNFGKENIRFIAWSDRVVHEECYRQALNRALDIYHSNLLFREAILRNTERYVLARLEDEDLQQLGGMRNIVEKAAYYLIEEMAFHEVFHIVLAKEPISSYYKDLELLPNYINGKYGNNKNPHVGWVVYNIIDSE